MQACFGCWSANRRLMFPSRSRERPTLTRFGLPPCPRRLHRAIMTSTEVLSPPPAVPLAAEAPQLKLDALNLPSASAHLVAGAGDLSNTQIGDVATLARSSFRNEAGKAGAVSFSPRAPRLQFVMVVWFRFTGYGSRKGIPCYPSG